MQRLAGKVAIITGGGGGLGGATARRFVAEGAKVVVSDISLKRAQDVANDLGDAALALFLDAGDDKSIKAVVDEAASHFGRIDILHNNHAWLSDNMPDDLTVIDTPFETWDKTMAVNLRGYFAAAKYVVPHMIAAGSGSVINMSSDSGLRSDTAHISYGVSKAAINMLTYAMATQHGRQGVRTNSIAPGLIVTPYVREVAGELVDLVHRHTPSPELGDPTDIAALCVYLASDEARFINGQVISCDGGLLAHLPQTADHLDWMARQKK